MVVLAGQCVLVTARTPNWEREGQFYGGLLSIPVAGRELQAASWGPQWRDDPGAGLYVAGGREQFSAVREVIEGCTRGLSSEDKRAFLKGFYKGVDNRFSFLSGVLSDITEQW